MPDSLGLSHQVMNSLHQMSAAKVSSEDEREKEDGTSASQLSSGCSGLPAVLAPQQWGRGRWPLSSDSGWRRRKGKSGPQQQFCALVNVWALPPTIAPSPSPSLASSVSFDRSALPNGYIRWGSGKTWCLSN